MTAAQAAAIAAKVEALLTMPGVEPCAQPISIQLLHGDAYSVTLHAVHAGTHDDYERAVFVDRDGSVTEVEREYADGGMTAWAPPKAMVTA